MHGIHRFDEIILPKHDNNASPNQDEFRMGDSETPAVAQVEHKRAEAAAQSLSDLFCAHVTFLP